MNALVRISFQRSIFLHSLWILLCLILVGCGGSPATGGPNPTQAIVPLTATIAGPSVEPTLVPTEIPAPTATLSPTIPPSSTPTREPTPTVVAWPTPGPGEPQLRQGETLPERAGPITAANFDQLVPLARWGKGSAEAAGFSADGRFLGITNSLGRYLYDLTSGEELAPDAAILDEIFPAGPGWEVLEGKKVSEGPPPQGLTLMKAGTKVADLDGHAPYVISWDGSLIAAAYEKEGVWGVDDLRIWNTGDGREAVFLDSAVKDSNGEDVNCGNITALAFHPDGKSLAAGCLDNAHLYWWPLDGSPPTLLLGVQIDARTSPVRTLFSPDGKKLAARYYNRNNGKIDTLLWDLETKQTVPVPVENGVWFEPAAFSLAGDLLAGIVNGRVLVWNPASGEMRSYHTEGAPIHRFAISPDGKMIALGSKGELAFASMEDGKIFKVLTGVWGIINNLQFSPDGKFLAVQVFDGARPTNEVYTGVRTLPDGERVVSIKGSLVLFGEPSMGFLSDGRLGVLVGQAVQIYSAGNWNQESTLNSPAGINGFAFSPDGETAALLIGNAIEIRGVKTGRVADRMKNLPDLLYDWVGFSPDGTVLLADGMDFEGEESVLLGYDLENKKILFRISEDTYSGAFSHDGALLALETRNPEAAIRNTADGRFLGMVGSEDLPAGQPAFSPDGSLLVTTSSGGSILLWGIPK